MPLSDPDQETSESNNERFSYEISNSRSHIAFTEILTKCPHVCICLILNKYTCGLFSCTGLAHFSSTRAKPNIWPESFLKHSHCALEFLGKIRWALWFWCTSSSSGNNMRQHRRAECIFGENFAQGLKERILTVNSTQQRECSRADQPACMCALGRCDQLVQSLPCRISTGTGHESSHRNE